jgi:putative DNA methylase
LHVWFARRPLATSRAAVLASLLPSGSDRKRFMRLMGLPLDKDIVGIVKAITDAKAQKRKLASNPFSWERAFKHNLSADDLKWLQETLTASWNGVLPEVLDPMAGGGSVPHESIRLGLPSISGDLNPVAYVIQKATVEYPARFGKRLVPAVEDFCRQVNESAKVELEQYYPKSPGEEVYAYLWSRTLRCQHCGFSIPLSPNWWIVNSETEHVAARPMPDVGSNSCTFEIGDPKKLGFDPDDGTDVGKDARCPNTQVCGKVNDSNYVRAEAQARRMGHQLVAVCSKRWSSGKSMKWDFRIPRKEEIEAVKQAGIILEEKIPQWEREGLVPNEDIPLGQKTRELLNFGMTRWYSLFNPRQLLSHMVHLEEFDKRRKEILNDLKRGSPEYDFAEAVIVYSAMVFDRCIDNNCLLSLWNVNRTGIAHAMGLQGFAFKTSYAEWDHPTMLWPWATGKTIHAMSELIELLPPKPEPTTVFFGDAARMAQIGDKGIACIVVDPPYAGNVMYGEVMNFFYVWMKRTVGELFPNIFKTELADTTEEAVANSALFKDIKRGEAKRLADQHYQSKMEACFREMNRVLRDDGVMTVMFTHKEADAWAGLATSLMNAGFTFRASWPVFTEPGGKFGKTEKGVLKVTVLLSCHKRLVDKRGLWEEVQRELSDEGEKKVREHDKLGISGPDLIVSTYGPVLGRFADYAVVKDATGKLRGPKDALLIVAEVVNKFLTADLPSADLETLAYLNLVRSFPYMEAEYDLARIATVFGGNISLEALDVKGGRGLVQKKGSKVHLMSALQRVEMGVINPNRPETLRSLIDTVQACLIVYESRGLQSVKNLLVETNRDSSDSGFLAVLRIMAQLGSNGDAAKQLVDEGRTANALLEALGHQPETVHKKGESLTHYF